MEFQPSLGTKTPYINIKAVEVQTNRDVQSCFLLKRFTTLFSSVMKTLGCVTYILFFAWQVTGLVLYSIRAFETTRLAKHTSFQSTHIEMFRHSEQLELAWLISQVFNTGLVILALTKIPSFLGYSTNFRLLVRLPSFWSLMSLYGMSIVRYLVIIGLKNDSGIEIALIWAFMIREGAQVIFICFLNFTQVNHSRKNYPLRILAFFKVNIFLFFLCYFVEFVICSLQLALHINGIDEDINIPSDTFTLVGVIRKLASIILSYRIYNFYWEKLFVDNRNILCHHDYLDQQFTESSPLGNILSTPANPEKERK